MYVTGIKRGWICCLAGGNKFYQYDIFFDEDLYTNQILPTLKDFWVNHVLKLQEPKVQSADNELFSNLFPSDKLEEEPVTFEQDFEAIGKGKNKKFLKVFKIVTGIIIEINICQIRLNRNYKNECCCKGNIKL